MRPRQLLWTALVVGALLIAVGAGGARTALQRSVVGTSQAAEAPTPRAHRATPKSLTATATTMTSDAPSRAPLHPRRPTAAPHPVQPRSAPVAPVQPAADPSVLPVLRGASSVIQRVATRLPYVAVTVDDFYTGDYRHMTAIHLLEAVNVLGARITLCPAGSALVAYAHQQPGQTEEIRRLVAAGSYEFCDHTYSHPVMPKLGHVKGIAAEIQEMVSGAAAIRQFFGRSPSPIFRPPFGSWDITTQQAAAAAGFPRIITWSIDSGDSEGPERSAEQLVANVACARQGDIILLHANRQSSAVALPMIIRMLRSKGLEPVGISTLLASGQPVYTTHPSDMRRLYTCTRPPVRLASPQTPRRGGPVNAPGRVAQTPTAVK